jgi:hypothetical protein
LSVLPLQDGCTSIPSSTLIRSAPISFLTLYLHRLSELVTLDGLCHSRGTPQSPTAPLCLDLCPANSFCTLPLPAAVPLPSSHTTSDPLPFLVVHPFFP